MIGGFIVAAGLLGILLPVSVAATCLGDCNDDLMVTVDELVCGVMIALDAKPLDACPEFAATQDGTVTVDELVAAVANALDGCPGSAPTPTPSATPRGIKVVEATTPVGVVTQIPGGPVIGGPPAMPAQYRVTNPSEIRVETLVSNLQVPWSMAFAPDGRLFITERPGRIRVAADGVLQSAPWAMPPVSAINEGGLMGLALDPKFADEPWVYVCYTYADSGQHNRISRIREVAGHGGTEQILIDRFPGASIHDGCRLKFGPDGKLYATTGDASGPSRAQDLDSLAGKILRLNPDGSVPSDNPFPDSYVYSYGHRNSQGLAFDPLSGQLFATEHGPSGEFGQSTHDEVNVIMPGSNYGWPLAIGAPGLPAYRDPILLYAPVGAPLAGATFYSGRLVPRWGGDLFFTSLAGRHLQHVVLGGPGRTQVLAIERFFETKFGQGTYGRLRDVVEGPDGALYVATSNRDGRGSPAVDDDRILRLIPPS